MVLYLLEPASFSLNCASSGNSEKKNSLPPVHSWIKSADDDPLSTPNNMILAVENTQRCELKSLLS
jgi:hypothetical protein